MARPGFGLRLREHLGSEEFESVIEQFLNKNAQSVKKVSSREDKLKLVAAGEDDIDVDPRVIATGEYGHEVHQIWQEYLRMIENNMDDFRTSESLTPFEFKAAIEELPKSQSILIRMMIASWEFQQFVDLCSDHCDYMTEQKQGDDSAASYVDMMDGFYSSSGKSEGKDGGPSDEKDTSKWKSDDK